MNFEKMYKKSLQMIKKYDINNLCDYIKLAKEKNLLNNVSLEYISGTSFNELLKEAKKLG